MDQDLIRWLSSPEGSAVLADLATRDMREATILSELNRLRRLLPAARARAAIDQALLRDGQSANSPRQTGRSLLARHWNRRQQRLWPRIVLGGWIRPAT
ncbi:hypothetical protein [Chloroflexus sp.]|uniref:hypothetical protein n=1 Tax=Chloroflexus sp. TaxID=1904827 RepID=UPI0040493B73